MRTFVLAMALTTVIIAGIIAFVFTFFDGIVTNPVLRIASAAAAGLCGFFFVALIDRLLIQVRGRGIA